MDSPDLPLDADGLIAELHHLRRAQALTRLGSYETFAPGAPAQGHWSAQTYDILGRDPSEGPVRAEDFPLLVHPEDRAAVMEAVGASIMERRSYALEYRIVRPDGEVRWVHSIGQPDFAEDGQVIRMFGTLQDVTERKDLEFKLDEARKHEAMGKLARSLAHDFGNLLVGIAGRAASAAMQSEGPSSSDVLEQIRDVALAGVALPRRLLAARPDGVWTVEPVDLASVLSRLTPMFAMLAGDSISLRIRTHKPEVWVRFASGGCEPMLLNLLVNARDAMPDGGTISIVTRELDTDTVELSVEDNGTGMTAEVRRRAFEPYFTTKAPGLGAGLGLSSILEAVSEAAGVISLATELGKGSTVTVRLGVAEASPQRTENETLQRGRILVIDDDPMLRIVLRHYLQTAGYEVVDAANAEDGRIALEQPNGNGALIICDLLLASRHHEVLRIDKDTRVIYTATAVDERLLTGKWPVSINVVLRKPILEFPLLTTVQSLMPTGD